MALKNTKAVKQIISYKMKNIKAFAVSGKMGSGKDDVASQLKSHLVNPTHISFATPLRKEIDEIAQSTLSIGDLAQKQGVKEIEIALLAEYLDGDSIYDRTPNSRRAIQYWGTDVRRKQNDLYWVNKILEEINTHVNKERDFYITDVRHTNEAQLLIDCGVPVFRLNVSEPEQRARLRNRDGGLPDESAFKHESEIMLDDFNFDREKVINTDKLTQPEVAEVILSQLKLQL